MILQQSVPASERATQIIMKDLMDAFLAEQFFAVDMYSKQSLQSVSKTIAELFSDRHYKESTVYIGDFCFLVEKSIKQGEQWVDNSPIYRRVAGHWHLIVSIEELALAVLQVASSGKSYEHAAVADLLKGLTLAVEQLTFSIEQIEHYESTPPTTPYEWFVKGEMIASFRDRPFHPLAKAKIGFTEQDYKLYMAEFGRSISLRWVAIRHDVLVNGNEQEPIQCLDLLAEKQRNDIELEFNQRGLHWSEYTVMPVHPWQLQNIILKDFQSEIANQTIVVLTTKVGNLFATSSVRSLVFNQQSNLMLKLPVSVLSLGASRYLPVVKLLNGLAGERLLRQALDCDHILMEKVFLCEEQNWWGYMPQTMGLFDDHPRHLAAQIRIYPKLLLDEDYKIIPMSSLAVDLKGHHYLDELFGHSLTKEQVIDFYIEMVAMFYEIAMRLFKVGILPEIHGQNCCLVLKNNKIYGLLLRDHDSVRLHMPYLERHNIQNPQYYIRPGHSNSLYNESIEKLMFYIQTLGTKVNLASIIEVLASLYAISEQELWHITKEKLMKAVKIVDIPQSDKKRLWTILFEQKHWPVKLIIRPLLEADGVPGAMPSGKGEGYNPFWNI
ncbi:IucA/IucC family protein [Lysinibacillus sp. FSL W8-0992]|uniref:IucA/IucC family protein n=1 Tax=Lysinibacillus sp. FSL W8-0992 TaxID=2954643 RepID=UPI0030FB9E6A